MREFRASLARPKIDRAGPDAKGTVTVSVAPARLLEYRRASFLASAGLIFLAFVVFMLSLGVGFPAVAIFCGMLFVFVVAGLSRLPRHSIASLTISPLGIEKTFTDGVRQSGDWESLTEVDPLAWKLRFTNGEVIIPRLSYDYQIQVEDLDLIARYSGKDSIMGIAWNDFKTIPHRNLNGVVTIAFAIAVLTVAGALLLKSTDVDSLPAIPSAWHWITVVVVAVIACFGAARGVSWRSREIQRRMDSGRYRKASGS